jgi:peptidoglycan/LPS O-acetylase OafA/YrhL
MSSATETPRGTRQRLDHVDAMRPIKQTAVISTHALIYFSPLSTSFAAASMLTLTHFSRDAFLFVSACMLAYSYRGSDTVQLGPYWKRRFMGVGLVYLVWTVIYFPIAAAKNSPTFPYLKIPGSAVFSFAGLHNFLFNLATGYYHLYFLLVLLEFYVLFPYIFWFLKRYPGSRLAILVGSVVWQIFFPIVIRRDWIGIIMPSKIETRLVFSYPLYLLGGVICAFYLESFHDWVVRHRKGILVATVLVAIVPSSSTTPPLTARSCRGHWCPEPTPLPLWSFPTTWPPFSVCTSSASIWSVPGAVPALGPSPPQAPKRAYGIYVSQMIWIIIEVRWAQHFSLYHRVPWLVLMLSALVVTYALGWLFSALIARTPLARAVVGRAQVPWSTLWPHPVEAPAEPDFGEGPLNLTDQ